MDYAGPGDGKQGRAGDTDPRLSCHFGKGLALEGTGWCKGLKSTSQAQIEPSSGEEGKGRAKQGGAACLSFRPAPGAPRAWSWCGHLMTNGLFSLYQVTLARIIFSSSIPSPHTVSVTETPTF